MLFYRYSHKTGGNQKTRVSLYWLAHSTSIIVNSLVLEFWRQTSRLVEWNNTEYIVEFSTKTLFIPLESFAVYANKAVYIIWILKMLKYSYFSSTFGEDRPVEQLFPVKEMDAMESMEEPQPTR